MFPPLGSKPLATWFLPGIPGVNVSSNGYLSLFVSPECSRLLLYSCDRLQQTREPELDSG